MAQYDSEVRDEPSAHISVVPKSTYVPAQSNPEQDRYFFAYTIVIRNDGAVPAKLISRHWIITHGNGRVEEVQGEGVVGEQPRLEPGETFRYTSAAMIETSLGAMHGSYQMKTDDGAGFDAEIPPFRLAAGSDVVH